MQYILISLLNDDFLSREAKISIFTGVLGSESEKRGIGEILKISHYRSTSKCWVLTPFPNLIFILRQQMSHYIIQKYNLIY